MIGYTPQARTAATTPGRLAATTWVTLALIALAGALVLPTGCGEDAGRDNGAAGTGQLHGDELRAALDRLRLEEAEAQLRAFVGTWSMDWVTRSLDGQRDDLQWQTLTFHADGRFVALTTTLVALDEYGLPIPDTPQLSNDPDRPIYGPPATYAGDAGPGAAGALPAAPFPSVREDGALLAHPRAIRRVATDTVGKRIESAGLWNARLDGSQLLLTIRYGEGPAAQATTLRARFLGGNANRLQLDGNPVYVAAQRTMLSRG